MPRIEESFRSLRVALETRISGPSVITITSARANDGSTTVATGLAEAFAEAGHETLLISAQPKPELAFNGRRSVATGLTTIGTSVDGHLNLSVATAEQLTAGMRGGRLALARALPQIRENFSVVIIDAEPIPGSSLAYELARDAEGVLVAVRLGRSPSREDRTTMKLLDDCGANVFGVVPTSGRLRPISTPETTVVPATVPAAAKADLDIMPRLTPRVEVSR